MPRVPETKQEMQEIARRGHELYDRIIRAQVEPQHIDDFVAVDVESGDFEVAERSLDATDRLLERRPDGVLFLLRAGHKATYSLGGGDTRIDRTTKS